MNEVLIRKTLGLIPDPAFFVDSLNKIRCFNKEFRRTFGNGLGKNYSSFLLKSKSSERDKSRVIRSRLGHLFHLEFYPYKEGNKKEGHHCNKTLFHCTPLVLLYVWSQFHEMLFNKSINNKWKLLPAKNKPWFSLTW